MNKDPNISTLDGLVHLATKLAIQIKSLEVACDNWDATLKIINTLLVYNPLTLVPKRGSKVRAMGEQSSRASK